MIDRYRSLAWLAAVAVVVGLLAAGCGGSDGASTASTARDATSNLRVAYVAGATFLPAMVAKDTGIFERNRLHVTMTPTQTISTIPGALGRQFDFGPATPPVLIKAGGSGIGVVGVTASTVETRENSSLLIARAGSSIRGIGDLPGKRIGTPDTGAALNVSTLNWLRLEGVDPKSVKTIEMPFATMADQLKAGRVDAVEAIPPFTDVMLKAGHRSIGGPLLSVSKPPVLGTLWIAQARWAHDHPEILERWKRSLTEAEDLIRRDPSRARAILQKYTQLPAAIANTVKLPVYSAATTMDALGREIAPWGQALKRSGQFTGNVQVDRLLAETNAP